MKNELQDEFLQQVVEKSSSYCAKSRKTLESLQTILKSESYSANSTACLNDVKKPFKTQRI
jgi:hypothetical protein